MSDDALYCPQCGCGRDSGASFCKRCGFNFTNKTVIPQAGDSTTNRLRLANQTTHGDRHCPACGASLSNDAILCTSCGLNLATGQVTRTAVKTESRVLKSLNRMASGMIAFLVALTKVLIIVGAVVVIGYFGLVVWEDLHPDQGTEQVHTSQPASSGEAASEDRTSALPAEPDWGATYSNWYLLYQTEFVPCQTNIWTNIQTVTGAKFAGVVTCVSSNIIYLKDKNGEIGFGKKQLDQALRLSYFRDDYAHFHAREQVEKGQKEWREALSNALVAAQAPPRVADPVATQSRGTPVLHLGCRGCRTTTTTTTTTTTSTTTATTQKPGGPPPVPTRTVQIRCPYCNPSGQIMLRKGSPPRDVPITCPVCAGTSFRELELPTYAVICGDCQGMGYRLYFGGRLVSSSTTYSGSGPSEPRAFPCKMCNARGYYTDKLRKQQMEEAEKAATTR